MTNYVFLTMPTYGHVNPTLAVAQELVQRGQEVIYYLPEPFQEAVEATGATFRGYDSTMSKLSAPASFGGSKGGMQAGPMAKMMLDESRHVLPQVLERIRADQPDSILSEAMCAWANITAQVVHVPTIGLHASYAMNEHFNLFTVMQQQNQDTPFWKDSMAEMSKGIAELCEEYHVPPFDLRSAARGTRLSIVFIPRMFQPGSETFDERYVFVGPNCDSRHKMTEAARIWFFWKFPQHVFMIGIFKMSVSLVRRKIRESCLRSSAYSPFAPPELAQNILVSPKCSSKKLPPLF